MPDTETNVRAINEALANVRLARAARNEWVVTVPMDTSPESVLVPEYWKHITHRFRVGGDSGVGGDIKIFCTARTWRAEYEILDINASGMTLFLLPPGVIRYTAKKDDLPLETGSHLVKFDIGNRWAVRRKSDNEVEKNRFETAQLAAAHMHEHYGEMAA